MRALMSFTAAKQAREARIKSKKWVLQVDA
jgi:hypothetical protein